jgi:hypothetical protein
MAIVKVILIVMMEFIVMVMSVVEMQIVVGKIMLVNLNVIRELLEMDLGGLNVVIV